MIAIQNKQITLQTQQYENENPIANSQKSWVDPEDIQMPSVHMKRCSTLCVLRELKV